MLGYLEGSQKLRTANSISKRPGTGKRTPAVSRKAAVALLWNGHSDYGKLRKTGCSARVTCPVQSAINRSTPAESISCGNQWQAGADKTPMTVRLGIVVAMSSEARMLESRDGETGQIRVQVSGIGRSRARAAAQRLVTDGAQALISWGTAVSLDEQLQPGHLVLPQQLLHAESGPIPVSASWRTTLHDRLRARFTVFDRPMITTDELLQSPSDKRRVGMETGAVSADMESVEVALVAREAGVPFVVLRSVADSIETPVPHWLNGIIGPTGQISLLAAVPAALGHPKDWASLVRLARDFNTALKTLRQLAAEHLYSQLRPDIPTAGTAMESSQDV